MKNPDEIIRVFLRKVIIFLLIPIVKKQTSTFYFITIFPERVTPESFDNVQR